ncbi:MAG: hypothetical protein LBD88_01010 [Candidatus Peribacteria bacterium]|nr:hypothetical protein [Candidatus Peribacteria bacterium]
MIISEDHTFTTKTFTDDIIKVTNKWLEEATITIQVDGKGKTISHQITSPGTYVLVEDIVSDTL